jgi:hypothetical protein
VVSVLTKMGRPKEAAGLLDYSARLAEPLAARDPANSIMHRKLAEYYVARAGARSRMGLLLGAIGDFQTSCEDFSKSSRAGPGSHKRST